MVFYFESLGVKKTGPYLVYTFKIVIIFVQKEVKILLIKIYLFSIQC